MSEEKELKVVRAWIQNEQGEMLLVKRGKASYGADKWEFPGGKKEEGENDQTGLTREVREETGLEVVRLSELIFRYKGVMEEGKHRGQILNESIYRVNLEDFGQINLDNRHTDSGWFRRDKIKELDLSEDARETIENIGI